MIPEYQNMSMQELVDLLAQKTQKFTQLLVEKRFDEEYKKCKKDIQQIMTQIEIKKEPLQDNQKVNGSSPVV